MGLQEDFDLGDGWKLLVREDKKDRFTLELAPGVQSFVEAESQRVRDLTDQHLEEFRQKG